MYNLLLLYLMHFYFHWTSHNPLVEHVNITLWFQIPKLFRLLQWKLGYCNTSSLLIYIHKCLRLSHIVVSKKSVRSKSEKSQMVEQWPRLAGMSRGERHTSWKLTTRNLNNDRIRYCTLLWHFMPWNQPAYRLTWFQPLLFPGYFSSSYSRPQGSTGVTTFWPDFFWSS